MEEIPPAVEETPIAETPATDPAPETQTPAEAPAVSKDVPATETKPVETPAESKPISRRSAAYRIQQLTKQVNQLKQQPASPEQGGDPQAELPDVNELVNKAIEARLNPIITEHTKSADDSEINELFTGDRTSERSKYEAKIRNMWQMDQYKNVAASDLYRIASFDDAVKAATTKAIEDYKKADKEAKDSSASGNNNSSNRNQKGVKSAWDMTEQEFQEVTNKALASG